MFRGRRWPSRGRGGLSTRGFGFGDVEKHQAVEPDSLFRIASISKPFTAAAILQLQERGKLRLEDHAFEMLGLPPHLEAGAKVDVRLSQVTIRQLLHHRGGFDRDVSLDPMFDSLNIARAIGTKPPAGPREIIEYMMGRPLDFDPGTREAYSNFGYCVLGRVIEKASGLSYAAYLEREVLLPLGIRRMRLGKSLEKDRADGEVHYYPRQERQVKSVMGDGGRLPVAYGGWCLESMDAHGGWLASAPELVRFASALGDAGHCPILKGPTIDEMFRPYDSNGPANDAYYACGWEVRPVGKGKMNTWHAGLLDGTASLLVRRHDGLVWAVLFNSDLAANKKPLAELIDPLIHPVADGIKSWPEGREFKDGVE